MSTKSRQPLASVTEVADYQGVAEITVRRWIWSGVLPAIKLRGRILIDWRDVDALNAANATVTRFAPKRRPKRDAQSTDLTTEDQVS